MLFFYVGTNIEVFFYMGNLQIHTRRHCPKFCVNGNRIQL